MEYCGPIGLAHSKFLKWSQVDRDKAIAWLIRNHSKCEGCGVPAADLDPTRGGDPRAYKIVGKVCPICRARDALLAGTKAFGEEQRWGLRTLIRPDTSLDMWQIGR